MLNCTETAHHRQREVARIVEQEQSRAPGQSASDSAPEGLRYRKKLKARLAVERAALELVIERGFDGVTVEDICARAEISKKTFFNYFPSKASAITGRMEAFPDSERLVDILEEHDGACYLDVLVGIVGTSVASGVDESIVDLRREALRSMPQLFFQGQRDVLNVQHSIAAAMRAYLAAHPERRMIGDRPMEEEALVASSIAIGIARTRSILHVYGDTEPTAAETRRLLVDYLSAGEKTS